MSRTNEATILRFAHVMGEVMDDDRLAGYASALDHLADSELVSACRVATQRCKYFPRPAELLDIAREARQRTTVRGPDPVQLPDNVMAMNAAVWPAFTRWLDTLADDLHGDADKRKARDDFLWTLKGQSYLHGVEIPWQDFALYGIELPWAQEAVEC